MWKQGPYRKRAKSPKSHLQAYQNIPLFIPYGPLVPTPPPLPPLNSSLPCTSLVHWDEQNLDTFTRLSSNLTDHILQQSNNNMNNATFSGYIGGDDCTGEALRKKELAIRARLEFYSRAKGRDVAIDIRVFAAMIVFFGLDLEKVKSKVNLNQRKILDFYQVKPDGADLTLRNLGICFAYEVCEFHHFHGQGRVEASAVAPECPRFVCHVSFIYLIPLNPAYEQWFWWHYRFRELLKSTLQNSVFQNRHLYSYCQHQQLSSPFEEHEKVQLLTRLCQRAGFGTSPDAVPLSNWNYLGETYPKISDSSKFKWSFTQSDLLIEELTRKPVSSSSSPSLLNNSGKGTSVNPSPLSSTLSLNSSSSSSGYRSNVDTKRKSSLDSSVNNINNNNNNNNSNFFEK